MNIQVLRRKHQKCTDAHRALPEIENIPWLALAIDMDNAGFASADIDQSEWDCTLEAGASGAAVLRLGFRMVKGLSEETGRRIAERRDP